MTDKFIEELGYAALCSQPDGELRKIFEQAIAEITRLEEALRRVRDEALEEAAGIIEKNIFGDTSESYDGGWNDGVRHSAEIVRALLTKPSAAAIITT